MANNIAQENIRTLTFRNGLWFNETSGQNPPAEGFSQSLQNLYVDSANALRIRPSVTNVGISFTSKSGPAFPEVAHVPVGSFSKNLNVRSFIKDAFYATGNRLWVVPHLGSGFSAGYGIVVGATNITGIVEANNFIYVCGANGVRRIDSVTYGPITINSSGIPSAPPLDGILYFKSRLFGFKDSKIYWTDPITNAAPDPETWSTTTNYTVLGSEGNRPKIYQMLTFNDRLYVFTDSGIFVVVIQGQPTSWIIRPYDLSIRVSTKDCAVVYKGIIYVASIDGVYGFSGGGSPQLISKPVNFYFRISRNYVFPKIFIAEHFLILSVIAFYSDGTTKVTAQYMMDLNNPGPWMSPTWQGTNGTPVVIGVAPAVPNGTSLFDHLLMAVFTGSYGTQNNYLCAFKPETAYDTIDGATTSITAIINIHPVILGHPVKFNHVKIGYVEWVDAPSTFNYTHFVDGGASVGGTATGISGQDLIKIKGYESPVRVAKLQISWNAIDGLFSKLLGVHYVIGTERPNPNEFGY